jgi:Domain of unknown function (DUF4260)
MLATHSLPTRSTAPSPVLSPAVFGVTGGPRVVLRVEAATMLAAALVAYAWQGGSWGWFAVWFLTPDLSMLGYLGGARLGAATYNAAHSYVVPAVLAALALAAPDHTPLLAAIIWVAHVGFDRMLGYGLKYGSAFGDTHLGRVGRRDPGRRAAPSETVRPLA